MNYPPPHPQPPLQPVKPKGGNGCLIAIGIFAAILVVLGIAAGVGAVVFMRSAEGQKAVSLVGEGISITTDALNAPGAKEVKALGCTQAAVLDLNRLEALGNAGKPDAAPTAKDFSIAVTCQVSKSSGAPTCDQVASAYRVAVGAPAGPYAAIVTMSGGKEICKGLYGVDGLEIRSLK